MKSDNSISVQFFKLWIHVYYRNFVLLWSTLSFTSLIFFSNRYLFIHCCRKSSCNSLTTSIFSNSIIQKLMLPIDGVRFFLNLVLLYMSFILVALYTFHNVCYSYGVLDVFIIIIINKICEFITFKMASRSPLCCCYFLFLFLWWNLLVLLA